MLYGHGDDFYNSKNEVKINFSSNVWHGANLDKLKEHLIEHFSSLTRYPEPDAATLRRLLARRYEIDENCIVVTNGSITAFYLLAQAWRGAKSRSCRWRGRISAGFVIRIIQMVSCATGASCYA